MDITDFPVPKNVLLLINLVNSSNRAEKGEENEFAPSKENTVQKLCHTETINKMNALFLSHSIIKVCLLTVE